MCTRLTKDETEDARRRSATETQSLVDDLIKSEVPVFIWLDGGGFRHWRKGFYYVRTTLHPVSTAYQPPALIVEKKKLRPEQAEWMERKCRETQS